MYVLIVNDHNDPAADNGAAEELRLSIQNIRPDVRCEIVNDPCEFQGAGTRKNNIRVQCFGEFEVFSSDGPLDFKRARTKELFAILVCHRGSMLSMGTLMSILWEDGEDTDSDRSYLRNMISDLKKTLSSVGAEDIVIKKYNSIGIVTDRIDCDYYDFLEGKWEAVEQYDGQFMNQYPWAEYELSRI
ncbi:MAG: hypothetical protein K6B14_07780 [Lachnospiraceae bacterium]|nr:hypothetical protein [Lachnospiraceae bacterium]